MTKKVAYILTGNVGIDLAKATVVHQLVQGIHNADPQVMFFLRDTIYWLKRGNAIGETLKTIMQKNGATFIACDKCVHDRALSEDDFIEGVQIACFPDFYKICEEKGVDYVVPL